MALDPDVAGAHISLGTIKALNDWDWAGAEAEFLRAIQLDTGSSDAHCIYGTFLSFLGRHEQAIAEARQGRELDSLSSNANYDLAFALYVARRYDEAIEQLQKTLELYPKFFPAHVGLGHIYAAQSRYEEALAEFAEPGPRHELTAWIYALAGRKTEALSTLADVLRAGADAKSAVVYAVLGENDKAFECLERGYEQHDWSMIFLKVYPPLDLLRSDPRFRDLLRRMNFPM